MEQRSIIERLARHLAAGEPDRSPDRWADRIEDAASILAIMKEPDAEMRQVGDADAWRAMIDAALRTRWTVSSPSSQPALDPPGGADEEGEIRLDQGNVGANRAQWVHVRTSKEEES